MTIPERDHQCEGLSIDAACQLSGIGRTKLYEAIAEGLLPARKYGKRTIILRTELQSFLNALPVVTRGGR